MFRRRRSANLSASGDQRIFPPAEISGASSLSYLGSTFLRLAGRNPSSSDPCPPAWPRSCARAQPPSGQDWVRSAARPEDRTFDPIAQCLSFPASVRRRYLTSDRMPDFAITGRTDGTGESSAPGCPERGGSRSVARPAYARRSNGGPLAVALLLGARGSGFLCERFFGGGYAAVAGEMRRLQ
jgi:hypothetical protein